MKELKETISPKSLGLIKLEFKMKIFKYIISIVIVAYKRTHQWAPSLR